MEGLSVIEPWEMKTKQAQSRSTDNWPPEAPAAFAAGTPNAFALIRLGGASRGFAGDQRT